MCLELQCNYYHRLSKGLQNRANHLLYPACVHKHTLPHITALDPINELSGYYVTCSRILHIFP